METGVVTSQEQVSTKTNVGEVPAGVILDNSSMEVQKVNLSTVLDDEIISGDRRNSIIQGETDVAEIVNGSGNQETEELKREKGEPTKTISVVEDSKIVSETEKDEQGSIFVHKPESLNKDIEDAKIISSGVTLEKEKETGIPEKAREEIQIKTDEVKEEKDSRTVETSANGTEAEHNATVSVEEISRNGDNIVKETVPEDQTATDGESLHDVETTQRVLLEVKKEEETNIDEEPRLKEMEKVETEIVKTVIEHPVSLKEIAEPVEPIKTSDDAVQISREVTVDKGKEEDMITQNTEEVQECPKVIETPTIEGEDIESKASLDHEGEIDKISMDTEVKSKEIVPEKETATDGESLPETETTKRFHPEEKEEMKTDEEPRSNVIEKVETVTVKTVIDDPEIVDNEETTVHGTESLKENVEPVEAIKSLDDAEQTSHEVTVNRAKEEEITQNTEEIQVDPSLTETSEIQGEDNESKASLDTKQEVDHSSDETEEHEHVLGRDLPHCETSEVEAVETKEETKPSLDLKEDKEKEETEEVKTVISSNEVSSSTVQEEEEFGEHTDPCSSEIKDESHGREESVEVKSKETVQEENTAEKHDDLLDVPSTKSEKYQENEPETTIVASSEESHEKFEEIPSDLLASNVDKEEQNNEKIKVDETHIMEEERGLDSNGVEAEQIDRDRTDETEESPVAKQVSLPEVEPVEQTQKPSIDSPSQVSEEISKTVDAKIDEKLEEEKVTLHQEDQEGGSYGLETKKETVVVPESIEIGEKSQEERSVIDLTPLQEESSQTNEEKEEPKLQTHELTNEEVKSDEVIEVSPTSLPKALEGETVVEAEKIETKKENEEEAAAVDNLETVETVESHNSLPSSSEEQEHGTFSEKIEDKKVEEVPMVSKAIEEQTIDMEPSLTEKCSRDQNQPEEQVEEACSRDEQEKEISSNSENIANETYALHSAEEETATNGESLHDVETTKRVRLEVENEDEEAETKTDAEPRLDVIEKKEIDTAKIVVEDIEIVNNEKATAHESEILKGDDHQGENAESVEAIKNSDDAEQISREVTGDREKNEDTTQKAEEVQESPRVIEIPTIQGEDIESKASLEIKDEVDQSSKDTEQHEHVLERDIPQCETLEAEAVDTSTVQEAAILNTLETNISETEAVHSVLGGAEEGQETKEDTETSLDLKVDKERKEAEAVKTVIFSDEVKSSDQAEEFGEHTEPYTSEIKNESQGREESVEIKSKDTGQDESSEEKYVNLPDVQSGESEKYQENEPVTSAVEGAGLNESTHNQTLVDVESVEKVQKPSLETSSELSEQTSKTIDEKIEEKPKEEVTLHQEGQEEGYNGLETKEETVSVPESRELGEKAQEEESCLQNEQKKEVKLQKAQIEKHEPTEEEVSNDQQSPVEEKSDDVSSALPSEVPEDETVVKAEQIGEEQLPEKMTVETSSLLSFSEEQEHVTVPEKTDGEEVKEAEPIGDIRERGLEIAETTHLSLPSVDKKEDVKAFDEEIQIPTATLPFEDQEKVTSTEKGETKANETEDDKPDEHINSSTSPMVSEENDDETQIAEGEIRDEEITVGTLKTSENVCMQQDEKPEATKLEELKEDKSQEIAETIKEIEATGDQTLPTETSQADNTPSSELVSEQEEKTPKQVEDIYEEEHKVEATGDRNLPVETSQAYQTPSSDLVSALNDQTPKHVEETHEEETKEEQKLQTEEILPTETIPSKTSDDALVSMLASKEDGQVALQEDNCADDVRETKDTHEELPVSVETEKSVREKIPKEPEDEDVKTPTSLITSETLIAEAKKGDEAISETETTMALETLGTSRESENVCIKQEELGNHEAPKLEEPKEEKSRDIPKTAEVIEATVDQNFSTETSQEDQTLSSELVSGLDDQTQRKVEQIQEEESNKGSKFEGTGDQSLPVETSEEYQTLYSDLASGLDDQTPQQVEETKEEHKLQVAGDQVLPVETSQADQTPSLVSEHEDQTSQQVEEIHEEETKVSHKVQAEEILSTKNVPRELFGETPVSMLAYEEDEPVTLQEGNTADDRQVEQHVSAEIEESVGETKPKEPEYEMGDEHVETPTSSIVLEKNDNETLIAEAKKGDEDINETETAVALESSGTSTKSENMSLKQEEFGNPEAPKLEESKEEKIQEIPETEKAIDATGDQSLPFETSQELKSASSDLALKQVEEVHEEETKEEHKLQVAADQILLAEASQADQIPSLASEQDDHIPKQVEEETKETQKVQADDAPVSMLASGEVEPVTPQEGNCAGDTLEERYVSVETEEKVGETKPKESEAEGTEKSDDLVETSTKLTEVEDAGTKKTDVEVDAENRDETYSTLPVVGILTELQNTLETERTINDSSSKGENMIKEPADQDQKTGDAGIESNEKDSAPGIIEANKLQQDESGETEKIQEENGQVEDRISREFEVGVEEKLQEGTREIPADQSITEVLPGEKIPIPSSVLRSEELEDVISPEKQEECDPEQDINASKPEKISPQEEQKDETHETVKEEDQMVDIKDEKKDDEEQETVSSEVNKDKEDASELGVGHDFVLRDVEKEEVAHGVLENEEEINEAVKPEKKITDPVEVITKASEAEPESNQEPVETQAISDDTKRNDNRDLSTEEAPKVQREEVSADKYLTKEVLSEQLQVPSSTALDDLKENNNPEADWDLSVQKPSELIQSHQSHNLPLEENVEEASFGVKNAKDDKNEENANALITSENLQVQDQPKDFEAPAIDKEISEQELTLNDPTHVQEDIGSNVKLTVHDEEIRADSHGSVVVLKEEAGSIEEKREVEHVKTELEDAIKHGVAVEEKNKLSENIQDIESLSVVSKTKDNPEQKDEVPNQQEREIADEVPNLETLKIAEEVQQKDGESENTKDMFSEVKETEPTLKEPARKSLSDLIQKVKGSNKTEDVTTEPHIEEEPKTVEEDENNNGDHEHDKTSPDSIVMVEAKDTVSIIKTHKKSQGILSGVGSKVKHSISKVKKVLTGKSSHTTKPSSPK